jgi:hypothetical protein
VVTIYGKCNVISHNKYNVSAVVWLQFTVSAMLCPTINVLYFHTITSLSMCAVPNMAVLSSSLIPCYPAMLHRYCLSDSEMVPVTPVRHMRLGSFFLEPGDIKNIGLELR